MTFAAIGFVLSSKPSAGGSDRVLAFGITGRSMADVVEQESPEWIYADNGYNQWQCTHDGTLEDYRAGGGVVTPDSCVHNPTPCVWDVDDVNDGNGSGYLGAGQSVTGTLCAIADRYDNSGGDDKHVELDVFAPADNLDVVLRDNLGHVVVGIPTAYGRGFGWFLCYLEHELGPFDAIPNSNGGTGREMDWTATVTAERRTNAIAVYLQTYGWLSHYAPRC